MSAINAFRSSRAVHVMSDGLAYDPNGVPVVVDLFKTHPIAGLSACVATTGPALLGDFLARELADRFDSFDAIAAAAAAPFRDLFEEYISDWRDGDGVATIVLAGWHERAQRPALYTMMAYRPGAKWDWIKQNSENLAGEEEAPFEIASQEVISVPTPKLDLIKAAGYDLVANLDRVVPGDYLLHMLEIQRRIRIDGRFLVGGHALLTSITAEGLTQRIVHNWERDVVGEPIRPEAIDWAAWRRQRESAAAATVNTDGLSRLQRERMLKKAKKGALRS